MIGRVEDTAWICVYWELEVSHSLLRAVAKKSKTRSGFFPFYSTLEARGVLQSGLQAPRTLRRAIATLG